MTDTSPAVANSTPEPTPTTPLGAPVTHNHASASSSGAPSDHDREEARKSAARERSRRYRERNKLGTAPAATGTVPAIAPPATPGAPAGTQPVVPTRAELAEAEKRVREALAGTVQTVAEDLLVPGLPKDAPRFGPDRSDRIAALWAPLLAPYVTGGGWVLWALAGSTTVACFKGWVNELEAWKRTRELGAVSAP